MKKDVSIILLIVGLFLLPLITAEKPAIIVSIENLSKFYNDENYVNNTFNSTYDKWAYNHTDRALNISNNRFYNKSSNINTGKYNITTKNINSTNLSVTGTGWFSRIGQQTRKVLTGWFVNLFVDNLNSTNLNASRIRVKTMGNFTSENISAGNYEILGSSYDGFLYWTAGDDLRLTTAGLIGGDSYIELEDGSAIGYHSASLLHEFYGDVYGDSSFWATISMNSPQYCDGGGGNCMQNTGGSWEMPSPLSATEFDLETGDKLCLGTGCAFELYSDGTNLHLNDAIGGNDLITNVNINTTQDVSIGDDLFLAYGSVINWGNGDIKLTESANTLTFSDLGVFKYDYTAGRSLTIQSGSAINFSSKVQPDGFFITNSYIGGAWARPLMSIMNRSNTAFRDEYFGLWGYGIGQTMYYGGLGYAYNDMTLKITTTTTSDKSNRVGISINGSTRPQYPLEVSNSIRGVSINATGTISGNILKGRSEVQSKTGTFTGNLSAGSDVSAKFYRSSDGSKGITDTSSYWLCTSADCSSTCQVSIKSGLITGCA